MIKIALYCFVLKLVFISVWCKGGKRVFVKCNKSCLYVCCKKENKKMIKKISTNRTEPSQKCMALVIFVRYACKYKKMAALRIELFLCNHSINVVLTVQIAQDKDFR